MNLHPCSELKADKPAGHMICHQQHCMAAGKLYLRVAKKTKQIKKTNVCVCVCVCVCVSPLYVTI